LLAEPPSGDTHGDHDESGECEPFGEMPRCTTTSSRSRTPARPKSAGIGCGGARRVNTADFSGAEGETPYDSCASNTLASAVARFTLRLEGIPSGRGVDSCADRGCCLESWVAEFALTWVGGSCAASPVVRVLG
jgi:hypothetical protein